MKRKAAAAEDLSGVRFTSPDRVLWPEQGVTKLALAKYYARVGDRILPHVIDRPLALLRCPQGRQSTCFFQKHLTDSLPEELHGVEITEKKGRATSITIRNLAGLMALVQIGTLEIHPWGARADRVERPDRLVFDLDPGPGVRWAALVEGALDLRQRLEQLGLVGFVRTTGGKGLHVVVPIERNSGWDEAKELTRSIALALAGAAPRRYLATMSKSERRGKIFVDYLRNSRGATAIASYSTRARPGATVATPLGWDELERWKRPEALDIPAVALRVQERADPWQGFFELRQSIRTALRRVGGT